MQKLGRYFFETDFLKSLRFSLHYFPFREALRLPILVARGCRIIKFDGAVKAECPVRTGLIRLGYSGLGTLDPKYKRTLWELTGLIVLKGVACIGKGSRISVGGELTLGDGFNITGGCTIICKKKIDIGANCLFSWDTLIMDTDFHPIYDEDGRVVNEDRPVHIGDKVWIGCRSTVLKGAVIPDGSVIAAASTITRKLPKGDSIYGGVGGELLKTDIKW